MGGRCGFVDRDVVVDGESMVVAKVRVLDDDLENGIWVEFRVEEANKHRARGIEAAIASVQSEREGGRVLRSEFLVSLQYPQLPRPLSQAIAKPKPTL